MKELKKLIDLKSIVTMLITATFVYGFIKGKIDKENFMTIATMIFTFYFASKTRRSEDNEG